MPSQKPVKKKSTSQAPILLIAAGLLLMVVAVVILLSGQPGTTAAVEPTTQSAQPNAAATATAVASVPRITPADALSAQQNESAVIVDVRSAAEFAQAHVAGAINIPYNDVANRINELDPARPVIAYCT